MQVQSVNEQVQTVNESERWDRVKTKLRAELGEDAYSNWFGRVILEENKGDVVRLSVPTRFLKHWIQSNYADRLVGLWKNEGEDINGVELIVRGALRPRQMPVKKPAALPAPGSNPFPGFPRPEGGRNGLNEPIIYPRGGISLKDADEETLREFLYGAPINPKHTFDSFVAGSTNSVAFEAVRKMATGTAQVLDLVYLHASGGFGKTHLLQAAATEARSRGLNVAYLTAEYFMYQLVPALKSRSFPALRNMLSSLDLLLIDDLQFLHGKQAKAEFCETLHLLMEPVQRIIVGADRPPQELDTVESQLKSRLCDGLVTEIQSPDFGLRRDILKARLEHFKRTLPSFDVPPTVLDFVACHVTSCGRDLEGAMNRFFTHHQLTSQAISQDLTEKLLSDLIRASDKRSTKIEDIQQVVCKHYNISKADLLSASRARNLVWPRQIAMYLSKVMTPRSLPEIGKRFGGRDHTTVLHAVRKIDKQSQSDASLRRDLALLKNLAHS